MGKIKFKHIEELVDLFDRSVNNLARESQVCAKSGVNADRYLIATKQYYQSRENLMNEIKKLFPEEEK